MVKVNIHQHQKGKPNLSKKIFGPEATLIQWFPRYFSEFPQFVLQKWHKLNINLR